MGCLNFASNCQLCPQVRRIFEPIVQNSALKLREVVNRYRDQIVLVSPSHWLAEIAKSVFPNVRVQHLFNCVDVDFSFEEFVRKNHKPLKNGIKIGFSSVDLNNSYKGLNVLLEALRFLPTNKLEKYELALFGTGSVENLPSNLRIRQFGLIEGRELQKEFLNLDALVVPSVQDNSPNVVIEAISLGIPVIGSDAGGIPELLQHFALPIFPNRNSKELSVILEAIPRLLEKKLDLMKARELFSPAAHGESLLQIYRSI
jgi:glycosyltransferase involved in cell wall biosynthesis